jgi:uncharacterized membrane protein
MNTTTWTILANSLEISESPLDVEIFSFLIASGVLSLLGAIYTKHSLRAEEKGATTWTVWVNGIEVTYKPVRLDKAREIAERYTGEGYTDIYIDNITWQDIKEGATR